MSRNSGRRIGWVGLQQSVCMMVSCTVRVPFYLMKMIYFKISQGKIRQMRETHTHISIIRMTSSGKIVSFILLVHICGQLEDSNDVIKFMSVDYKHGQAVNLFINCKQQDILQLLNDMTPGKFSLFNSTIGHLSVLKE